jgi:uncharacterized delta-60 repeat protein
VNALTLQPDGKIVAVGTALSFYGYDSFRFALARYRVDGELDETFGVGGIVTTEFPFGAEATAAVLQPDGKIVAVGSTYFQGAFGVARYNTDGSLDVSFGNGGTTTTDLDFAHGGSALAVTVQPDGRILVAGFRYDPDSVDFVLARYNADGSPDITFGINGKVISPFGPGSGSWIFAETFQPDGKIVAAGVANFASDFALARYNADGSLDTSFGIGGMVTTDFDGAYDEARAAVIQSDGKIVAAGSTGGIVGPPDFALARFDADGSPDATFGNGGKVATDLSWGGDGARALAIQSGGAIVAAGGGMNPFNYTEDFVLARYTPDGVLDEAFGSDGGVFTAFGGASDGANALLLQFDGKIVAAGYATVSEGALNFALARYHGHVGSAAELWIGLKNSDDQGTQFDLRAALYVNDTLVAEGETRCIIGVTRNPLKASVVTVPFDWNTELVSGDILSVRISTRIGTNPDGSKCPGHSNAVGLRLYYDAVSRPSGIRVGTPPDPLSNHFLHSIGATFFLDTIEPTSTDAKRKDSGPVNFARGNPWAEIGTWSQTVP